MITPEDSKWHYIMGDIAKAMGPRKFFLIYWFLNSLKTTAVMALFYVFRNNRKVLSWLMVQQMAKGEINPKDLNLGLDDGRKLIHRIVITTYLIWFIYLITIPVGGSVITAFLLQWPKESIIKFGIPNAILSLIFLHYTVFSLTGNSESCF